MANEKISELTALTTPVAEDVIPIVDNTGNPSTIQTKKITVDDLILSSTQTLTNKTLTDCDASTQTAGNNTTKIATTAFVTTAVAASDTLAEVLANGNTTGATDIVVTAGQAITTDTISETTSASGVTIDGVVLKDTAVTTGAWNGSTVDVAYGGTGATSLTDGGVLLGSGTGAITAAAVLADGEILVGDGTTDPVALDVGSSTAITTLGTVTTGTWEGTAVTNANLANSAVTVGSTSISLGSTEATISGLTLVAPALGTPASGVATNLTGTASGLTAGSVTTNANLTGDVTSSENATTYNNVIPVAKGGTTLTGFTAGDVLYADTTTTLAKLAKGSDTEVLTLASGVPSWAAPTTGDITGLTEGENITITSATGPVPTINVDNPLVADVTGDLTGNADTVTNGVYTTNNLSVLSATTSAQLAGVISDETGSGALVFATSPTLVTPVLGTPASGTLTNCTFPTLNQDTTGTAATVTGAAQTAITSVGTLTDLTVSGTSTTIGTVTSGTWQGTAVDGTYIDLEGTEVKSTGESSGVVLTANGSNGASWTSAGSGTVTGTGADNQVAVWDSAGTGIEGTTGLTYDGSTLEVAGSISATENLLIGAQDDSESFIALRTTLPDPHLVGAAGLFKIADSSNIGKVTVDIASGCVGVGETPGTYAMQIASGITGATAGGIYSSTIEDGGQAVYGVVGNEDSAGTLSGIRGSVSSTVDGSAATGYAVYGNCAGSPTTGYGVYGSAVGTGSTTNYGGYFTASGATGSNYGVYSTAPAYVTSTIADTTVIYGVSDVASPAGTTYALRGANASAGTGTGYGVHAAVTGANATNIAGYFSATNGTTRSCAIIVPSGGGNSGFGTSSSDGYKLSVYGGGEGGLYAQSIKSDTEGIRGHSDVSTAAGTTYGVRGTNNSAGTGTGYGVHGAATGANYTNYGGYFTATGATSKDWAVYAEGNIRLGAQDAAPSYIAMQTTSADTHLVATAGLFKIADSSDVGKVTVDISSGRVTVKNSSNSEVDDTLALVDVGGGDYECTPNFDDANNFSLTMDQIGVTMNNPTNITAGQSGCIVITQDGTSNDIDSWGTAWHFEDGVAPTLSTVDNEADNLVYYVASATSIHAVLLKNFKTT